MVPKKWILGAVLIVLFLLPWTGVVALAAPMPPLVVVNRDTQECAEIFGGDECMDCFPPEGWEILGMSSQVECPEGYTRLETLDYTCQGFKNQRCCTEGHTGAHGTCADLVVNDRARQCAFVDTMENCSLPKNWAGKPADTSSTDWSCPAKYTWMEDPLECTSSAGNNTGDTEAASGRSLCPFAALAGPVVILFWLLIKRLH